MNQTIIAQATGATASGRRVAGLRRPRVAVAVAAVAVLTAAPSAAGSSRPACTPLVTDDRGDTDTVVPGPRPDLDVLAADFATTRDGKTLTISVRLAQLPATPVRSAIYDVFFKAGQLSYLASGYRGLDGDRFRLQSDRPTVTGTDDVRPITGSFDLDSSTARFDIPLAELTNGKSTPRAGEVLYGITVVTAESFGTAAVTAGVTVDGTSRDNIYRLGAPGCSRP